MESRFATWFSKLLSGSSAMAGAQAKSTLQAANVTRKQVLSALERFTEIGTRICSDTDGKNVYFSNHPGRQSVEEMRLIDKGVDVRKSYSISSLPGIIKLFGSDNKVFRHLQANGISSLTHLRAALQEDSWYSIVDEKTMALLKAANDVAGFGSAIRCPMNNIVQISVRHVRALEDAWTGAIQLAEVEKKTSLIPVRRPGLLSRRVPGA